MNTAEKVTLILALWVGVGGTWAVSSTLVQLADLEEAKQLNDQAVQLLQQGQYAEAVPSAQKALNIREKALGPDHPDVAQSLNNLEALYKVTMQTLLNNTNHLPSTLSLHGTKRRTK
jgi:flagellin-specific chaperone FliS